MNMGGWGSGGVGGGGGDSYIFYLRSFCQLYRKHFLDQFVVNLIDYFSVLCMLLYPVLKINY